MLKIINEDLVHVGDLVRSTASGEVVGKLAHDPTCSFKIVKFDRTADDPLTVDSVIFSYAAYDLQAMYVEMTPELYKERVLEHYHRSVATAQSVFNCAEKRAKEICAQMLEVVNVN